MVVASSVIGCGILLGTSDDDAIEPGRAPDAGTGEDASSEDAPLPLDAGLLDVALDAGQDADAGRGPLRFFVTSNPVAGAELNGSEGGDARCTLVASGAGLQGQFRANLELQASPAHSRFPDAGTWVRLDGQTAFASGLTTPQVPLNVTERGFPLGGGVGPRVWTGVPSGGTVANCDDWKGGSTGETGNPFTTGPEWQSGGSSPCNAFLHLYCFEVP